VRKFLSLPSHKQHLPQYSHLDRLVTSSSELFLLKYCSIRAIVLHTSATAVLKNFGCELVQSYDI